MAETGLKTAWGEATLSVGTPGTGGAMGAALTKIGEIEENSLSVETADGKKYELKGSGGKLLDSMTGEPTLTVKATVVGLAAASPFWTTETKGTGAALKKVVKSLVCSTKKSVKIATKVVGSDYIEFPNCSANAKVTFSEEKGWLAEMEFTLLQNSAGEFFQIGQVV